MNTKFKTFAWDSTLTDLLAVAVDGYVGQLAQIGRKMLEERNNAIANGNANENADADTFSGNIYQITTSTSLKHSILEVLDS